MAPLELTLLALTWEVFWAVQVGVGSGGGGGFDPSNLENKWYPQPLFSSLPVGGKSWAFMRMCAITWAAFQLGFTEATTAAIETACGVAILVPLQAP